jgi:hypothetical protein
MSKGESESVEVSESERVLVMKGVWVEGMKSIIRDFSISMSRHVLQWIPNVSLRFCTG